MTSPLHQGNYGYLLCFISPSTLLCLRSDISAQRQRPTDERSMQTTNLLIGLGELKPTIPSCPCPTHPSAPNAGEGEKKGWPEARC